MFQVSTLVLLAMVGLLVAWLGNQLPSIGEFPGRNWLIVRSLFWLTLILVAQQGFEQDLSKSVDTILWCVVAGSTVALLYEAYLLVSGLRRLSAIPNRATNQIANQPSQERADELRQKLLKEMRRRVDKRLAYVYGGRSLADGRKASELLNVAMLSDPAAVGDWSVDLDLLEADGLGETVYLSHQVPQCERALETFADKRWTTVPSEKTVLDTFLSNEINGKLLILGAAGSGKTTALLKLVDDLLKQAEVTGDIPYIFELSAWQDDEQEIASWLIAQLKFEHDISEAVSCQWILDGKLIPLLDGLDELAPKRQSRCIERINEFVIGLDRKAVVCCREKAYAAVEQQNGKQLNALNGALRLQPLSEGQIKDYFQRLGRTDILEALQEKDSLGALLKASTNAPLEPALLKIPLFLQILAAAYQPQKVITNKKELFDAYLDRRLSEPVRQWDRSQASKKVTSIQFAYDSVETEPSAEDTECYLSWLAHQLNENSIPNVFLIERMQPNWLGTKAQSRQYRLVLGLIWGFIWGLIFCLIGELLLGLTFGLVAGLTFGLKDIKTVEVLKFSSHFAPKKFFKELIKGLMVGLIVIPLSGLTSGLILGLTFGLKDGLIEGLREDFKTRETPNQGMIASAKNIPFILTRSYIPGVVLQLVLLRASTQGEAISLGAVVAVSLIGGFGWALSFSLEAIEPVVKHALLRYLLYRQGRIPWDYAQFLQYTTERRLTQQVGGSFRFIHRELLDHFDLDKQEAIAVKD